jgi:hypothetical protein
VGAANVLTDTSWLVSRNENDSPQVPPKTGWSASTRIMAFLQGRKVLNLCEDSKRSGTVTFLARAQNKFIKCLRSNEAEANFPTTCRRYADK